MPKYYIIMLEHSLSVKKKDMYTSVIISSIVIFCRDSPSYAYVDRIAYMWYVHHALTIQSYTVLDTGHEFYKLNRAKKKRVKSNGIVRNHLRMNEIHRISLSQNIFLLFFILFIVIRKKIILRKASR